MLPAAAGFGEAEVRIERDVLDHGPMRIQAQLAVAEARRLLLRECNQRATEAGSLAIRPHRDVVEQQMGSLPMRGT
ncbi:MAG: hypothetical protein WBE92_05720 [Steroidobacteraceae bacterium]